MRISIMLMVFGMTITINHLAFAQNTTYSLEIHSLTSDYGTTFGPEAGAAIRNQWPEWRQVSADIGDHHIQLRFVEGLDPKQYVQKRNSNSHYHYQVQYLTPQYQALVKDRNGKTILEKSYGGEKVITPFGKKEAFASPETLATSWRQNRELFYQLEESKHNHTDAAIADLVAILGGTSAPILSTPSEENPIPDSEQPPEPKTAITTEKSVSPSDSEPSVNDNNQSNNNSTKTTDSGETPEQREARFAEAKRKWDEMEKADEERHKKPRVRHGRLGLRLLVPNALGLHGEVVLPVLNNRISIVGDYSWLPFGFLVESFLDEDQDISDEIDASYQYLSAGINFYFRKKYARGWYVGASYLKNIVKSDVSTPTYSGDGQIDIDAAALRLGLNTGRKTFMFGFEVGAGIPFSNLEGDIQIVENGEFRVETVDEKIPVIPILNVTLGVAL